MTHHNTAAAGTRTPISTVIGGVATPRAGEPTRVIDVLSGPRRPGTLPPTGEGGFTAADWGWLITLLCLSIGVLVVVLLRQTFFSEDDRN